jgi:hypothetical protein
MGTHAQAFLDVLTTSTTFLRGIARRDSDDLMTSSLSLIVKDTEKRAPTGVVNALGEMVVLHHARHVQVFDTNATVALYVLLSRLEMEIAALATDFQMHARDFAVRFAAAMASLLATTYGALRMREALLPPAIVARILYHPTI